MAGISLADFDPSSASSAFGEIVRREINDAGGGTYLADVETGLARRRGAGSTGSNPPATTMIPALGVPPWALYAGAAVAAALVLYLVLRK